MPVKLFVVFGGGGLEGISFLKACSHGGGGPRVGEVPPPRLGNRSLYTSSLFFLIVFTLEVGYLTEAGCPVSRAG